MPFADTKLECQKSVIYVLPYLEFGGTEYHVLRLAQSICWRTPPLVLAPEGPLRGQFEATGIKVLTFGHERSGWHARVRSFKDALFEALRRTGANSREPPILHVHSGAELLWLAHHWIPQARFLFTDHGYFGNGAGLSYYVAARVLRWTRTRVIAVSRRQQSIWTRLGLPGAQVVVIYNGVPDPLGHVARLPTPDLLPQSFSSNAHEGPSSGRLIGAVARLAPQKGIRFLVDAFAELARTFSDIRLFVAGDGPQRSALERQISQTPWLHGRVRLAGWIPDASAVMRYFHIYCHPSLDEALPLAIIEAMASRCAVVATRVGAVSELIEDGISGLLVPPGDAVSLRRAIEVLLRDETLRARLGENARRRYEQYFTVQKMAHGVATLYRNMTAGS